MFVLVGVCRASLLHAVCPMDVSRTSFRSCSLSSVAFVHILMEKLRFALLQHTAFLRHPCAGCAMMRMLVSMCYCCVDETPRHSALSLASDAYATNLAAGTPHIRWDLVHPVAYISQPLVLLRAPDPCGEGNVPLTFSQHHTYAPSQVRGAYDMREKLGARRVSE